MIGQDTREILAFRINDEKTGDMPQLKCLIDDTLEKSGNRSRRSQGKKARFIHAVPAAAAGRAGVCIRFRQETGWPPRRTSR